MLALLCLECRLFEQVAQRQTYAKKWSSSEISTARSSINRESNSDVKFGPNYEAFAQNRGVITVLQHFDFCTTCI